MTISLFRIYSTWFDNLPTPFSVITKFYDTDNLRSVVHSFLAGGSLVMMFKVFKQDFVEGKNS